MQMEPNIEEVKRTDAKMVRVDLNWTMVIFMKEHFDQEKEKDLENALSIKKGWPTKVNGKMINDKDMEDRYGQIKVLSKVNGIMEECNQEFLLGLTEAITRVSSLIM